MEHLLFSWKSHDGARILLNLLISKFKGPTRGQDAVIYTEDIMYLCMKSEVV